MENKASLGTTARIITMGVTILFTTLAVFGLSVIFDADKDLLEKAQIGFMILLLLVVYVFCYLYRPLGYMVDRENITVHRPLKSVIIPLKEIGEVFQVSPESMKWTIRTFGNGGLFGLYGKFWNTRYGNMTWYATRTDNVIMVVMKNAKKIVLSPDQLSMLDEILRRLKPTDSSDFD